MAGKTPTLTFMQKKPTICPVCGGNFLREEMLTGRGRMIAGDLTNELRRPYEVSKKFGEIHPLIYPVSVCPHCYYAAWKEDFSQLAESHKKQIEADTDQRMRWVRSVIDEEIDFLRPRKLSEGLASYILCTACYDYQDPGCSPIIKQGISSLRGAWLAVDMHQKYPDQNYAYLAKMLYRKARFFYLTAIDYESSGQQSIRGCANLGPDIDKNYMFDGVLYVYAYLEYNHGPTKDPAIREENLRRAKKTIARIFGMGKATKDKPVDLLNRARDLYDHIARALGLKNAQPEQDADDL